MCTEKSEPLIKSPQNLVAISSLVMLITWLTHWSQVTHICVGKLTTIDSDNGLSPGRRQAIIWTNAGLLLIGLLGKQFSEILIGIQTFSFKKMHLKMSSAKRHPFCFSLNVLNLGGIMSETFVFWDLLFFKSIMVFIDSKPLPEAIKSLGHWHQKCLNKLTHPPQYPSIGSDNGLAPNKQQAIIWTNAAPIHWRIYAALDGDELIIMEWIKKIHF